MRLLVETEASMRRLVAWVCAAVVALAPLVPVHADVAEPIALPEDPVGLTAPVALPTEVDARPLYQPQVSCHPVDMPGTLMLRDLVLATYAQGRHGNISRSCTEGTSEHSEGRAWDWMIDPRDKAAKSAAADFLSWLTRDDGLNARRLGVMYVIYNKKIWAAYRSREGWRPSSGHTDHIHISLSWNGARGNVSFWTGRVHGLDVGPCRVFASTYATPTNTARAAACAKPVKALAKSSRARRQFGHTGKTVATAQRALKVRATGSFDQATWRAVRRYQKAHDLPMTGALDHATWASLAPSTTTYRAVKGYGRKRAANYGIKNYGASTLRKGRAHRAVMFLQIALGMPAAQRTGYFGERTRDRVRAVQKASGLRVTGTVSKAEWREIRRALD